MIATHGRVGKIFRIMILELTCCDISISTNLPVSIIAEARFFVHFTLAMSLFILESLKLKDKVVGILYGLRILEKHFY